MEIFRCLYSPSDWSLGCKESRCLDFLWRCHFYSWWFQFKELSDQISKRCVSFSIWLLCKLIQLYFFHLGAVTPSCLASNFSSKCHPWIKHCGQENKENEFLLKELLIVKQIFFVITKGVRRTVRRICTLIVSCKGFNHRLFPLFCAMLFF